VHFSLGVSFKNLSMTGSETQNISYWILVLAGKMGKQSENLVKSGNQLSRIARCFYIFTPELKYTLQRTL
jgi:hypothetical protein